MNVQRIASAARKYRFCGRFNAKPQLQRSHIEMLSRFLPATKAVYLPKREKRARNNEADRRMLSNQAHLCEHLWLCPHIFIHSRLFFNRIGVRSERLLYICADCAHTHARNTIVCNAKLLLMYICIFNFANEENVVWLMYFRHVLCPADICILGNVHSFGRGRPAAVTSRAKSGISIDRN